MCNHGDEVLCAVTVDARDSHTGEARQVEKGVDRCIASLVNALNAAGITTRSSCCGHGREPGVIMLSDGRALAIATPVPPSGEAVAWEMHKRSRRGVLHIKVALSDDSRGRSVEDGFAVVREFYTHPAPSVSAHEGYCLTCQHAYDQCSHCGARHAE